MKKIKKQSVNKPISPRSLALDTLLKVESGQYANIALDTAIGRHSLTCEDKALYTSLVYGVLERKLSLDFLISHFSSRPFDDIEPAVLNSLRLGFYQLIYLDRIPDFAAINETVDLVCKRSAGFVNALLRSYIRFVGQEVREKNMNPTEWATRYPELANDHLRAISVSYSLPIPLCKKLMTVFGSEHAESIMTAFLDRVPTTICVNTTKGITPDDVKNALLSKGFETDNGYYAPRALHVTKGSLTELDEFDNGCFFVQDEASQICVEILGATAGDTIIDTCSCPGSKSFNSAIRMNNSGNIYSFDIHDSKLSLIRSGAMRLGIDIISTDCRDAKYPDVSLAGQADKVLCDVPCSGLGVIAKKPEIRYKDLNSIARLPNIQYDILNSSADYVRPGGLLVYSTCTILPEENENVVRRFLENHPDFSPLDFSVSPRAVDLPPVISRGGCATLLPDVNRTDGFFIARMIRRGTEEESS